MWDVNPIWKFHARQVYVYYVITLCYILYADQRYLKKRVLVNFYILHNVVWANLSRIQFCNLINISHFCVTLLTWEKGSENDAPHYGHE